MAASPASPAPPTDPLPPLPPPQTTPTPALPVRRQLSSDVPPTPGDLAWEQDSTDWTALAASIPRPRYVREPGPDPTAIRPPTPPAWTGTELRVALTRMLTTKIDPTPTHSGSYALPTRMARHVKARDVTCTFPGCPKLAQACQNDHLTPWPVGKTHLDNIASECIHHHQSKTQKYFTVTKTSSSVHWTTKNGHTTTREPRPLLRGW